MPPRNFPLWLWPLCLALPLTSWIGEARGQGQCNGDGITDAGYVVRAVKVEALFGRVPRALADRLASHRGEQYRPFDDDDATAETTILGVTGAPDLTKSSYTKYKDEVKEYLGSLGNIGAALGASRYTEIGVRTFYPCIRKVTEEECRKAFANDPRAPVTKCVDVTVKVATVYINTGSLSANLLALARSNRLRFYEALPRPLIALNPKFRIEQDREYGPAIAGGIATNLLDLPKMMSGQAPSASENKLLLQMSGRKSAREPFYDIAGGIGLLNHEVGRSFETLGLTANFVAQRQPQGGGALFRNAARFNGSGAIKFDHGAITNLTVGAGYRWANNRYFDAQGGERERAAEHAFETRAIAEGHILKGALGRSFWRGAVWMDAAAPGGVSGGYRRMVATAGYAKEFAIRALGCSLDQGQCAFSEKNPPAIGVEALFSGGRIWGKAPEYARFYGGDSTRNFLYDSPSATDMASLPGGPLLRSVGRNRAGAANAANGVASGGTAYWNFSLNISAPVPGWSRPLIPTTAITDGQVSSCQECVSLQDVVVNQVEGEKNLYIASLTFGRLTAQQQQDLRLDPDDNLTPDERKRLNDANTAYARAEKDARAEADRTWAQITPMVDYIAKRANLYSVKPLMMFDAARLWNPGAPPGRESGTRFSLGGGLQLNVVVAKFEVGYLRTLNRDRGDQRGNFVVRMVFEKFF